MRIATGEIALNDRLYIRREADEALYAALRHGELCQVFAPRRSGKSSLVHQVLARLKAEGARCAAVDLSGLMYTDIPMDILYYSVADELWRGWGMPDELGSFWDRNPALSPLMRFEHALGRALESQDGLHVAFLDEADAVLSSQHRSEFYTRLRSFYIHRSVDPRWSRLAICLAGVLHERELRASKEATELNVGKVIRVTDFTRPQLDALSRFFPIGSSDLAPLLDRVYDWTDGHPAMTMRLCASLIEGLRDTDPAQVDLLVGRLWPRGGRGADPSIGAAEHRLLAEFEPGLRSRQLDLYRRVLRGEERSDVDSVTRGYAVLTGAVKERGGGSDGLVPRNRIIASVLSEDWVRSHLANDLITQATARWVAGGRVDELLMAGAPLRDALAEAERVKWDLAGDQLALLRGSETAEAQRTQAMERLAQAEAAAVAGRQRAEAVAARLEAEAEAEKARRHAAQAEAEAEKALRFGAVAEAETEKAHRHAAQAEAETERLRARANRRITVVSVSALAVALVLAAMSVYYWGEARQNAAAAQDATKRATSAAAVALDESGRATQERDRAEIERARADLFARVATRNENEATEAANAARRAEGEERTQRMIAEASLKQKEVAEARTRVNEQISNQAARAMVALEAAGPHLAALALSVIAFEKPYLEPMFNGSDLAAYDYPYTARNALRASLESVWKLLPVPVVPVAEDDPGAAVAAYAAVAPGEGPLVPGWIATTNRQHEVVLRRLDNLAPEKDKFAATSSLTRLVTTPGARSLLVTYGSAARLLSVPILEDSHVKIGSGGAIKLAALSFDAKWVATVDNKSKLTLVRAVDGLSFSPKVEGSVFSLAFSPSGRMLVWGQRGGGLCAVVLPPAGEDSNEPGPDCRTAHPGDVSAITFSSGRSGPEWLASADSSGRTALWRTSDNGLRAPPALPDAPAVWLQADGSVTSDVSQLSPAAVATKPQVRATPPSDQPPEESVASQGSGSQSTTQASQALPSTTQASQALHAVAFSADGSLLATGGEAGVTVWDLDSLLADSTKQDPSEVSRLWSAPAHRAYTRSLAFGPTPSDTRLLSAGDDNVALLWSVREERSPPGERSRDNPTRLSGHTAPLTTAVFSPDGRRVITAGEDGATFVRWIDPDELPPEQHAQLALACEILCFQPQWADSGIRGACARYLDAATLKRCDAEP